LSDLSIQRGKCVAGDVRFHSYNVSCKIVLVSKFFKQVISLEL
jgi:hypothetical protein